jgi:aminomethyltransferase
VQGPRSLELTQPIVECDLASMKYYTGQESRIASPNSNAVGGIVSRTGYTGEDGVELIVGAAVAERLWSDLLSAGEALGAQAIGLGARDTLRLEAALPLYGHELNEDRDPLQAGLNFAIDLDKTNYPGCEVIRRAAEKKDRPRLVGLELAGRRPAREQNGIVIDDRVVGAVTSGTFSPTLDQPIAMGYVESRFAEPGTNVEIDIRGRREPATVVKLPFYKRAK